MASCVRSYIRMKDQVDRTIISYQLSAFPLECFISPCTSVAARDQRRMQRPLLMYSVFKGRGEIGNGCTVYRASRPSRRLI